MSTHAGLQVHFHPEGGHAISLGARYLEMERRLGGAVRWRFCVYSDLNEDSEKLHKLSLAVAMGRVTVRAEWHKEKRSYADAFHEAKRGDHYYLVHQDGHELGPFVDREKAHKALQELHHRPSVEHSTIQLLPTEKVLVTGTRWEKDYNSLIVDATSTLIKEEVPNPLLPRWRVHHVDNLEKLAKKFSHLVKIPSTVVGNVLQEIKFPDKDKANVLQAGLSDWDFVRSLLWQYEILAKDASHKPLILSGSVSEQHGTHGRWIYTWARPESYKIHGEIDARLHHFEEGDGHPHPVGESHEQAGGPDQDRLYTGPNRAVFWDSAARSPHYILPGVHAPRAGFMRHRRPFQADTWKKWRQRDVPLFTREEKIMCWRIVDRLYDTHSPSLLGWNTWVEYLPSHSVVAPEHPALPWRTWMGEAKVKKTYTKGPWVKAELPGYHNEYGENIINLRLLTPHSGKRGNAGLHLIPEMDTKISLAWSGRFDESVVYSGNIRMSETEFPHPSVWLESDSIGKLTDLRIKSIGKTDIESDWKVGIAKKTSIDSGSQLTVAGDGVKGTWKGAILHVAQGKSSDPYKPPHAPTSESAEPPTPAPPASMEAPTKPHVAQHPKPHHHASAHKPVRKKPPTLLEKLEHKALDDFKHLKKEATGDLNHLKKKLESQMHHLVDRAEHDLKAKLATHEAHLKDAAGKKAQEFLKEAQTDGKDLLDTARHDPKKALEMLRDDTKHLSHKAVADTKELGNDVKAEAKQVPAELKSEAKGLRDEASADVHDNNREIRKDGERLVGHAEADARELGRDAEQGVREEVAKTTHKEIHEHAASAQKAVSQQAHNQIKSATQGLESASHDLGLSAKNQANVSQAITRGGDQAQKAAADGIKKAATSVEDKAETAVKSAVDKSIQATKDGIADLKNLPRKFRG